MTIEVACLVMAISAILFSIITAPFAILAYCKVVGMEKSTHQIQWVNPDDVSPDNPTGKDLMEKMSGMYEDDY